MPHIHDIVILGATPAGLAAGRYLAGRKHDVVVVECPVEPAESPLCDWAPADIFSVAALPNVAAGKAKAHPFRSIIYHSHDDKQQAEHRSRSAAGFVFATRDLDAMLRAEARRAGVRFVASTSRPAIHLGEDAVEVAAHTHLRGRLMMIACGQPSSALHDLALPVQRVAHASLSVAGIDVPMPAKLKPDDGELHVVQTKSRNSLGMFFRCGQTLHARVIAGDSAAHAGSALPEMLTSLRKSGLIPDDLPVDRARGAIWSPPAGLALELETHVAKRCLLIGTAGGFADLLTGQTLSPSIKSAMLAGELATEALRSDDLHEATGRFKTMWRKELAGRLRPPSTSVQMLMPLLFSNSRMVARFTNTLLTGETI